MNRDMVSTLEDEQILGLLDRPDAESACIRSSAGESSPGLSRVYVEMWGLLAYDIDEAVPPPELKARLLEQVRRPSSTALPNLTSETAGRSAQRWLLPLAATLALLAIGVSAWQVEKMEEQAATIARLSDELERAREAAAELAVARELAAETRTRLEIVTATTAEYCALKPTSGGPFQQARGILVMLSESADWFLRVEGLEPGGEGSGEYRLWFLTDTESILGASFTVTGRQDAVEVRANGIPTGTRSVMITMETVGGQEDASPQPVLYGDERMRIL